MTILLNSEPTLPNEVEKPLIYEIENFLKIESEGQPNKSFRLVGPDGQSHEIPETLFRFFFQVVIYLSEGKAVSIVPVNTELTTQEAADILNVSRPYLIKILEKGLIPFSKVGTHRRIRFSDLMKFKENRDTQQQEGLAEITRITQELGTYD